VGVLRATGMDDVYQHAKRQIHQPAGNEMVTGFREKMEFIRKRFKHNAKTVDSCLNGMGTPPTLLEVLTAAFVVNGGVLFKHGTGGVGEEEEEDLELNELMQEIQELSEKKAPDRGQSARSPDRPDEGASSSSKQGGTSPPWE
jgi:hypothetical protein